MFDTFPILVTERLRLRETHPDDAEAVFHILSQPKVVQFYNISPLLHIAEAQAIVDRRARGFQMRTRIRWSIARPEDNRVIGSCGFVQWNEGERRAEIGYELDPEYWGQGLMHEALTAMLSFGFGEMNLHRVEALVMPENTASAKVVLKLGFSEEGTLRDYRFWQEAFHDLRLFSLLHPDWERRNG